MGRYFKRVDKKQQILVLKFKNIKKKMKIGNAKQFVNLLRSLSSALIEIKIYISDGIFRGKSHKMIQCETNAQLGRIS